MLRERLLKIRKEKGLSREKLAEMAGVSTSTITFLENGRNESSKFLVEIANALGVSAEWLKDGTEQGKSVDIKHKSQDSNVRNNETLGIDPWDDETPLQPHEIEVPYFKNIHLSAGDGCFALEDYSRKKLRFSKYTLKNRGVSPESAACVIATGDSMEPVIPDNCTVAVDMSDTEIKDGKIYAINNDGLLQVKILRWVSGNEVSIESYNPSYKPIIKRLEDITVLGRVFWYSVLL